MGAELRGPFQRTTPPHPWRPTMPHSAVQPGGLSGPSATPTAGPWRTQIISIFLVVLMGLSLGGDEESRANVIVRALAGVNTDLENVTNQRDDTQDRLREAYHRIRQLEAQLAGEAPPPVPEDEPPLPALSPPRKKLRFGDRGYQNRFY